MCKGERQRIYLKIKCVQQQLPSESMRGKRVNSVLPVCVSVIITCCPPALSKIIPIAKHIEISRYLINICHCKMLIKIL